MGSYDPVLSSFTPTKYLGTTNSTSCVTGYDQAGFVAATSSGVFNQFNISVGVLSFFACLPMRIAHAMSFSKSRPQQSIVLVRLGPLSNL